MANPKVYEYLLPFLNQLLKGAKARWMTKNPLVIDSVGYDDPHHPQLHVNVTDTITGHKDRISLNSFAESELIDRLVYTSGLPKRDDFSPTSGGGG